MQSCSLLIAKPFRLLILLGLVTTLAAGCATVNGVPCGVLYSNIKGPLLITNDNQNNQVGYNSIGVSKSTTIFFLINIGDAGIQKAIQSKIAPGVRISHVDFKYCHFLGCGVYQTIVYYYDPAKNP